MVTVIHNDIDESYTNHEDWIKDGITHDAVCVCARQWVLKGPQCDYRISIVRNKYWILKFNKLNRW